MELVLNPPVKIQESEESGATMVIRAKKLSLDEKKRGDLELEISRWVEAWKRNASPLHRRLREVNDHLEGIVEDVTFPWPGASKVTMGVAAGMGRTLHATFDRAVFPDQAPFAAKAKDGEKSEQRNDLENAVNWLSMEENNLVSVLRDTPIQIWRDGTVPIMGEWERRVEKACDYKTYHNPEQFKEDYPDPQTAGISEEKYSDIVSHLSELNAEVSVEFLYDEVVYNAPKFFAIPLARFVWHPLTIEELDEANIYGRQFFESLKTVKTKIKRKQYEDKPASAAIAQVKGPGSDPWGRARSGIEGLSDDQEDNDRLENYKLVLVKDLDDDDIPEKYILVYNHDSKKILSIERYRLRKNINCVVLFRFIRRDGRLLGVSGVDDGFDQFRYIDDLHRHRQNVRALTDCPVFICPESLKDQVDFGGMDSIIAPGVTFYIPDQAIKDGKVPSQMQIHDLSNSRDSMDEESNVMRYLEMRLGPSQGLSGQESQVDPRAPASKTLAQLKQATLRLDDFIREWKRPVPDIIAVHNALYYQHGPSEISYGTPSEGDEDFEFKKAKKDLFAMEKTGFGLKCNEVSLSPEFEMEKVMGLASIAAQSPLVLQMKPQVGIELWNDVVLASRTADPKRLMIPIPPPQPQAAQGAMPGQPPMAAPGQPAQPGTPNPAQLLANGNLPTNPANPGSPTLNQAHAQAISRFLVKHPSGGALNGKR